ncbi:short chain dehydrogenase [Nesidiocoris tenuis]|uniref:3-dehydrosphinganine reductase n=1 Tax=Nesidiocoris tenuis TaxID=355587 RepID=A0ABN7ATF2_9HEMI|nr:short chain dehydrogenase [Nesidiocoris tenuis]
MEFAFTILSYLCSLLYFLPLIFVAGILYDFVRYKTLSSASLLKKHVVITGASSGIGKSFACEAARRGANVTLVARNVDKLKEAEIEVKKCCIDPMQGISTFSVDVTQSYSVIREAFAEIEKEGGPIFMLMNCAGTAVCGILEDISPADIKNMTDLNYHGSVFPTKAVIEGMKSRGEGHVIFTASEAAFLGIYGLAPYSASKYALRGFAEALQMEVKYSGLQVTVAFPPDTDTPGFEIEELSKPRETRLICQSSGLLKPDTVAIKIMNDALHYNMKRYLMN